MSEPAIDDLTPTGNPLLEAHTRISGAQSALNGLVGLLQQAHDLSAIDGTDLAALLRPTLEEVSAAADEMRSAAGPLLRK